MASSTEVCNLAISHLGYGTEIQNLETENSAEAKACRRYYTIALKKALRAFSWPFANKVATLQLVSTNPTSEWAYAYQYPNDCVMALRILSGQRFDTNKSKIPYKLATNSGSTLIYTDQAEATLEHTALIDSPSLFTPDFMMAFSYQLAFYLVARLTSGDPFKVRNELYQLFKQEIMMAKAHARNEEQSDVEPDSEYIQARY